MVFRFLLHRIMFSALLFVKEYFVSVLYILPVRKMLLPDHSSSKIHPDFMKGMLSYPCPFSRTIMQHLSRCLNWTKSSLFSVLCSIGAASG